MMDILLLVSTTTLFVMLLSLKGMHDIKIARLHRRIDKFEKDTLPVELAVLQSQIDRLREE